MSTWLAFVALIQTLMQHIYADNFTEKCIQGGLLSPIGYLAALFTTEFCVVFGVDINYICKLVPY